MPKYEFQCIKCNDKNEFTQSIHDPLTAPQCCGYEMRQVFGTVAVSFKGSGFYATDNRR